MAEHHHPDPSKDPTSRSTLRFCNLPPRVLESRIAGSIYFAIPYHTVLYYTSPELGDLLFGPSRGPALDSTPDMASACSSGSTGQPGARLFNRRDPGGMLWALPGPPKHSKKWSLGEHDGYTMGPCFGYLAGPSIFCTPC